MFGKKNARNIIGLIFAIFAIFSVTTALHAQDDPEPVPAAPLYIALMTESPPFTFIVGDLQYMGQLNTTDGCFAVFVILDANDNAVDTAFSEADCETEGVNEDVDEGVITVDSTTILVFQAESVPTEGILLTRTGYFDQHIRYTRSDGFRMTGTLGAIRVETVNFETFALFTPGASVPEWVSPLGNQDTGDYEVIYVSNDEPIQEIRITD